MSKRYNKAAQPGPGPCANAGPSLSESCSLEERAGAPPLPYVELRPTDKTPFVSEASPVEPVDLPVHPIPERPPETRATILADLQAGFASLTDEELRVARMWLYGRTLGGACRVLQKEPKAVRKLYRAMRRKLNEAILGVPVTPPAQPSAPENNGQPAAPAQP